jgi:hypothetical protein
MCGFTTTERLWYGSFLKLHGPCEFVHLCFQVFQHLPNVSFQDMPHLLQVLGIVGLALQSFARPLAVAQMIFQANLELAAGNVFGRKVEVASTQGYVLPYQLEQLPHAAHAGERPQVFRAVADDPPGKKDARERLVPDDDIRIGLVVLQFYIVSGTVMFDQRVFQQKGIMFRIRDGIFYMRNQGNEFLGLEVVGLPAEIGADALP